MILTRLPTRRTVWLVFTGAAIVVGLWFNQHRGLKAIANETHTALCAFKTDLQKRLAASEEFVSDVREGRREPIAGISDADFRRSIANQRATLKALESLNCN